MNKQQIVARIKELKSKKDLTDEEANELKELAGKLGKGGKHRSGGGRKPGTNDVSWWDRYPELTAGAINLPFNYIPGTTIFGTSSGNVSLPVVLGQVAKMEYIPTIGQSTNESDPFNAQMRQLWLDMHRKYRGIGTYEKSDLGIVIFCIVNAFTTLAKFERIYGVINTYQLMNRNVPYTLKEALGISNDIEQNLADFRYQLNFRIAKLAQLCLPKGMSILEAELILNSFIFKDSENPRASLFMYDPIMYYVYDAQSLTTGGCALAYRFSDGQNGTTPGGRVAFTTNDIMSILDTQIAALITDDDVARMCSDLLAAYGTQSVMTVGYLPEDYIVNPMYDYERQLQFHNATIIGDVCSAFDQNSGTAVSVSDASTFYGNNNYIVIYQQDNMIINRLMHCSYASAAQQGYTNTASTDYGIPVTNTRTSVAVDLLFDVWKEVPDKADIMCGSRFTILCNPIYTFNSQTWQYLNAYGSEIVVNLVIYDKNNQTVTATTFNSNSTTVNSYNVSELSLLSSFDWHPIFYLANSSVDYRIFGDLDNFTILRTDNLRRLHEVALFSAFKLNLGVRSE